MTETSHAGLDRRTMLKLSAATLGAGAGVALFGDLAPASAAPAPVLQIPQVTLRWGAIPFTNHCWTVLAAKAGFLGDVGIAMSGGNLPGTPKVLNENQVIPQIENKELDVSGHYFGGIVQSLDKIPDSRPVFCFSYFQGRTILCSPTSGYKTVQELLDSGMPWEQAAKQAVGQMKGKKFGLLNEPSALPFAQFALATGGLTLDDVQMIPLEDPKTVQLAIGNQIDFAAPSGGVQIYQLEFQAHWKSLIDMPLMIKSMPGGKTALSDFLNYDLIMCTADFLDKNHDTILRMCGALYRTLDYMFGPDQKQALSAYAPFINAVTGAKLDADSIKFIFENMDPFFTWDMQEEIWTKPDSVLYYRNIFEPQIAKMIKSGALTEQSYDLDKIFAAKGLWEEMKALKARTESLLAKPSGAMSGDRQVMFDAAKQHYAWRNYLDSARLAQAAFG